jgi:hypothetical protein
MEFMVRVFTKACKQKFGFGAGWRLDISVVLMLVCPTCNAKGCFKYHGFYTRYRVCHKDDHIKIESVKIERLRCKSCNTTHGVIPYDLVPWLSYSLPFILQVLSDRAHAAFNSIERLCEHHGLSTNTFYRLKRRFSRHIRLLLGATTEATAIKNWLASIIKASTEELDAISAQFLKCNGVTLCQPRRVSGSNCANAP